MTFISFKQLSPLMLFVITFTHSTLYCSRSLSCSRLFKWLRRVRNHFLNAFKITSSGWLWVEFIKAVLFFGSQMSRFENTCVRHHLMNMSFLHLWYASSGGIFLRVWKTQTWGEIISWSVTFFNVGQVENFPNVTWLQWHDFKPHKFISSCINI